MSAEWKDTTSYSRGQDRVPTAWTIKRGDISVTVTSSHIHNPGRWTMHCHALNMDTVDTGLPSDVDAATAQHCALNMAAHKAREIAKLLSK